jgi:NTP pyrophosphatase (non-canonical NTP hydrolase)
MRINDYQKAAIKTAIYGSVHRINYPILGLVGEAGELANKYKKVLRDSDGKMSPEQNIALRDELGDVMWYCALLARDLGANLEDVCELNLAKLQARKLNNTIHGSGDKR